jgi:LmbE family N-acetylglucosaminyl deacetylase
MSYVVLSPHLDDGVFSVCDYMLTIPDALLLTVFAGFPPQGTATPYDTGCGFEDSRSAIISRRFENATACEFLGLEHREWDFLDGQYGVTGQGVQIIDALLEEFGGWDILMPLGLHHPDHVLVSESVEMILDAFNKVYVYADLPYAGMYPLEMDERLQRWITELVWKHPCSQEKQIAVQAFVSQIGDKDAMPHVLGNEMVWRIK